MIFSHAARRILDNRVAKNYGRAAAPRQKLERVAQAATEAPAKALRRDGLGSHRPGSVGNSTMST